jgi:integrase
MALYKRNRTWWTDFSVNGQRFRQSLDTKDWRAAQAKEKELITQASQGNLAASNQQFARLALTEALDRYLTDRSARVAARSHRSESDHAKPLRTFFAVTPVNRITTEMILDYIRDRKSKNISNTTVNMEIGILRRILKRAKRWHFAQDEIRRLPERKDVGRALAPEEKLRLLRTAATKPEWEIAYLASVLALNTTMRGCELKQLRWRDLNLMERTLTVQRSKTQAGERLIPLNSDAFSAVLRQRERAKAQFGDSLSPDWYVFPHAEGKSKPDPKKPMSGWRSAWRKITKTVRCPSCNKLQDPGNTCSNEKCKADISKIKSSTAGLRFHDLRHHAITELAESQTSDQTIMAIAGHVSPRMLAHYSHVRLEAKRTALDAISSARRPDQNRTAREANRYDTYSDTNRAGETAQEPQVVERNGGDDETRTRDLCRDRAAF